jgi:hypothetical protein
MEHSDSISADLKSYLLQWVGELPRMTRNIKSRKPLAVSFQNLTRIADVSRKSTIISDNTFFFEEPQNKSTHKILLASDSYVDDLTYDDEPYTYSVDTYLETSDPLELTKWYRDAKQMVSNDKIVYIPKLYQEDQSIPAKTGGLEVRLGDGMVRIPDAEGNYELVNPKDFYKAVPSGSVKINDPDLIPLFNLTLPAIESISLTDLNKLMDDHPEKLLRLRNYLLKRIMDVKSPLDTFEFSREIKKIEIEIQDSVSETTDRYKQLERTQIFKTLGGVVVPWTFTVLAFCMAPTGILQIIGPGGAIASLSISLADFLKEKYDIGREPVDFLILIGKSKRKWFRWW